MTRPWIIAISLVGCDSPPVYVEVPASPEPSQAVPEPTLPPTATPPVRAVIAPPSALEDGTPINHRAVTISVYVDGKMVGEWLAYEDPVLDVEPGEHEFTAKARYEGSESEFSDPYLFTVH